MALKISKSITPSRRKMSFVDYSLLARKKPEKSLVIPLKRAQGRDKTGQISVRHKGGGVKRKYRIISSLSERPGVPAKVEAIEYDPNRSAFIALVKFKDGKKAYILAWEGAKVGDEAVASEKTEIKGGNRLKLKNIPTGTEVYDLEIHSGQGGKLVRGAGSYAMVLAKDAGLVQIKMPSGEIRKISENSFASIGQVSNLSHNAQRIGKAGRKRWLGIRPTVRGKAMHPAAHPHGGGEGVNPIGLKFPKTPWGKPARGVKTRKRKKYSDKFILKRRK